MRRTACPRYGFRRGRFTADAILRLRVIEDATGEGRVALVIGSDVANAFNSLPWSVIGRELAQRGVPQYLRRILSSVVPPERLRGWDWWAEEYNYQF